ncbi:hypothetical protein ACWC98_11410 [Streptomyces goshikiensis]
MRLDEILHIRLGLGQTRRDLGHAAFRAEQLQTRHLPFSTLPQCNSGRVKIVSGMVFGLAGAV